MTVRVADSEVERTTVLDARQLVLQAMEDLRNESCLVLSDHFVDF